MEWIVSNGGLKLWEKRNGQRVYPDYRPKELTACFGGPKRNRLFMAASHSLYAVYTATQGAAPG